jgi:hypothetical protein
MSLASPSLDYLVRSWHPGYLDSPEPSTIPKGGTPDAKNCVFANEQLQPEPRATLAKRNGCRLLTPAQVVSGRGFDGLVDFRKVGQVSGRMVGVIGGGVYYWDNISAFVQIGVTTPFAIGTHVRFHTERNLLFIMDGTTTRCWDGVLGSDLFTPGQVAPTSAAALTDAGAVGGSTLVSGAVYEGYAVWYDTTHDHETSPSAISAQLTFGANGHGRTWAKPSGAPGSNYDSWRVYCRRVDTNETYYKRVVSVVVATLTSTEALSDAARNLQPLGPLPLQNDPPPLDFVLQAEFQGYRLGVRANDDQVYVSKINDPQAQHPNDVIGVSRGVGGEIRSISRFATNCVVQKASRTYRLKGDRMPFIPDEVHTTFGNVGAESAVEVQGRFYCWDEQQGPYWTDLNLRWVPIATAAIENLVQSVPATFAKDIQCVYVKFMKTVFFSVPTNVVGRRRVLIGWHTDFQSWLPPITGLEYAAIATFLDPNGDVSLFVADYWGRLYQYFTDLVEGVPSGSLVARVARPRAAPSRVTSSRASRARGRARAPRDDAGRVLHDGRRADRAAGAAHRRRRQPAVAPHPVEHRQRDHARHDERFRVGGHAARRASTIVVGGIDWYWRAPVITFGEPLPQEEGRLHRDQREAERQRLRPAPHRVPRGAHDADLVEGHVRLHDRQRLGRRRCGARCCGAAATRTASRRASCGTSFRSRSSCPTRIRISPCRSSTCG